MRKCIKYLIQLNVAVFVTISHTDRGSLNSQFSEFFDYAVSYLLVTPFLGLSFENN